MIAKRLALAVLVFAHQPSAHSARLIQRGGHIRRCAIGVPRACAHLQGAFQVLAAGALVHQVDGSRWIACAGHQAVGAAHNFHAIVHHEAAEDFP